MSTKIHQRRGILVDKQCPREFTLRKYPLEFAHFEKKCPREFTVPEKSPSHSVAHFTRMSIAKMWRQKCVQSFFFYFPLEFWHGHKIQNLISKSYFQTYSAQNWDTLLVISASVCTSEFWAYPFTENCWKFSSWTSKKNWCGNGFVVIVNCKLYAISWEGNIFSWNYLTTLQLQGT